VDGVGRPAAAAHRGQVVAVDRLEDAAVDRAVDRFPAGAAVAAEATPALPTPITTAAAATPPARPSLLLMLIRASPIPVDVPRREPGTGGGADIS